MKDSNTIEAQVTTPSGTTILIKGSKDHVAQIVGLFTGDSPPKAPAPGGKVISPGSLERVAETDAEGNVHIVVTDLKAKSAMDAATRLIYVTLLARRELLREKKTERSAINAVLKSYNLYDGNTRNIIPRDKALVGEGRKYVSLSGAALPKAWEYVQEIHDAKVTGTWAPGSRRRRSKNKAKKTKS